MENELEQLKKIELEMLKAFINVCEQLDLKYYIVGGTLLGAVRHKGFIPWDDDIDVGMPRKDYEIFIENAQSFLPSKYFIQTHITDPEWMMHFCKIRNSETTFIESSVSKLHINHGVFIDIFPLDFYNKEKFPFKNRMLAGIECSAFSIQVNKAKLFFKKVISFCFSLEKAYKKREELFKSQKEGEYIANYCGAWGEREIMPKDYFGQGGEGEFEGLKVILPEKYDLYLTHLYGNYMELPPIEKRVSHHYTDIIDLEKSYKFYTEKSDGDSL